MQLAHFRSTSIQGQLNYAKKCWNKLLLLKEKIPAFQIQLKEENWIENTNTELLNLEHLKTKARTSDESHTTFISTSESTTPTPLPNKPLDKTVTSTENIFFSTPILIKNCPIPKSPPEILSLRLKAVTLKRNKLIYSKTTNVLLKLFGEVEFVKQYDFLQEQLKTSKTAFNIKNTISI